MFITFSKAFVIGLIFFLSLLSEKADILPLADNAPLEINTSPFVICNASEGLDVPMPTLVPLSNI